MAENSMNDNSGLQDSDYCNFKTLIKYFVAHLEHNAKTDKDSRKNIDEPLKTLLKGKEFVASGHYNSKNFQRNISDWTLYPMGRMSITIGNTFGDWTTKASYIQWRDTGLNIVADWNQYEKKIESLSFSGSCSSEGKYKIDELQLSDDTVNDTVKRFLNEYAQEKIQHSLDEIVSILENNKNLILTGAPGTGKTYLAEKLAVKLTDPDKHPNQWTKVQFHPSYDYTDFVEGIRPKKEGKTIGFEYKQGTFMEFCAKAALDKTENSKWVFIIDEINRGELNKIFGELFSCIEAGYRGDTHKIATQYQNIASAIDDEEKDNPFINGFYVPENIYIIGTMNDIDRSVESIDFALRRRFCWREIGWDYSLYGMTKNIDNSCRADVIQHLSDLNEKIANTEGLGESFCLGGAYIKDIQVKSKNDLPQALRNVWRDKISLVIKEYLRGQVENLDEAVSEFGEVFLNSKKN